MKDEIIRTAYLDRLMRYKDIDVIKIITGMRRVGKSYLMRQFRAALEESGIRKENILYIDMESMRDERFRNGRVLYDEVMSREGRGRLYLMIDEVQNVGDWVRTVESIRNDADCDIYITGSNAYMLSTDIATLLTGRSITLTVLPLSFREFRTRCGEEDVKASFLRYMRHGGLPILRPEYSEEAAFQLIESVKSDIILKDICNRRSGIDTLKIRRVIDYLYSETGNPISVKRMSEALGIGATTVGEYMQLITDSMLFIKADRYDLKGRKVLAQEPKYYCSDIGMRYSQPISSGRDFGKTLETVVYHELLRRGYRVYVGRTAGRGDDDHHLEIDFIVMKEDGTDYYQVTRSLEDPAVREREVRPFREVTGRGERYILTYDDVPRSHRARMP